MNYMKMLLKARYARIAGLALGAVAVAGAAVVVTASAAGMSFGFKPAASDQPAAVDSAALDRSNARSSVCTDFMGHFAVEIGKSQAQINTAFQKAIADTLADEVKNGKLTQAQADELKARLASQTPCTLPSKAPRGGSAGALGQYLQAYTNAAAAALGITPAELQSDLKGGQTLSQIAAAHNVSEADFRTKLIANLQPTLDAAVKNGKLTSTQEQALINRLKTGPLPLWNRPAERPKAPGATATPTPTSA